jgi:uncharacterized membrane protein
MFGFVVGALSLVGLMKLKRVGQCGGWGQGGVPRRWMLRRLFRHLETTPRQETLLLAAVDALGASARAARLALMGSGAEFAASVRQDVFDGAPVDTAFEKHQLAIDDVRKVVRAQLAVIHEVLTPQQRQRVAEWLEVGPRHWQVHGCSTHGHC